MRPHPASLLPPALLGLTLLPLALLAPAHALAQSGSFGSAVVSVGDELIVAEPNNTFRPGTVYVYRRDGDGWREAAALRAPDARRADGFGAAVAATGSVLFVAQRAGPVHVFERDGGAWRFSAVLPGTERFGFHAPQDPPPMIAPNCNQYGYCDTNFGVALAAEGDWLLVAEEGRAPPPAGRGGGPGAAPQAGRVGAVHLFRRGEDGRWRPEGRLQPEGLRPADGFGAAIAVSEGRALVGAPGWSDGEGEGAAPRAGRVFEFRLEDGRWREAGVLEARSEAGASFGAAIALTEGRAVIGAPGSADGHGAALLYRLGSGGVWTEVSRLAAFNSQRGDRFGAAVALDGPDLWVGAPAPRGNDTGMVYLYQGEPDAELLDVSRRIRLTETVSRDEFGDRVFARGGLAAVTASGMHHQAGAVFLYARASGGEWQGAGTLVSAPDALEPLVGEERSCTEGRAGHFDCEGVDLLAFVPVSMLTAPERARGVRMNDNWGWTDPDTGREYALVGRNDGTSFVDITDPVNPVLVGDLPKTPNTPRSQLWRDIKTYGHHAFIVADGAGQHGMQVFDLRRLRDVADPPALFEPDALYTRINSAHNIVINPESGFAFIVGAGAGGETCGGGLHMVDVREPTRPTFAGCFVHQGTGRTGSGYTHDAQCVIYRGPDARYRGREICLGANERQLSVADVTDKANPVALGVGTYPNPAYLHQGWLTDDHRHFFMDDESDVLQGLAETTRTTIWDLSDLENPVLAKEFMGSMATSAHNLYVHEGFVYQANYRHGLHVLDVSDPLNPVEVGSFDTAPLLSGPGFSGAWSNYPFFASGTVIVTSVQDGLFVLRRRPVIPD